VNALATNQIGDTAASLMAAFTLPAAAGAQANPAFLNMIGLFLNPTDREATIAPMLAHPQAETVNTPAVFPAIGTPAQIACAMIHSMLGKPSALTTTPVPALVETAAPNAAAASTNLAVGDANTSISAPVPPVAQVPAPRKTTRDAAAELSAPAIAPAFVVSAPILPTAVTPLPIDSNSSSMPASAPESAPAAPQCANPPSAPSNEPLAFTAVLTPIKDNPPSAPKAPAQPIAATVPALPDVALPSPAAAPISTGDPLLTAAQVQSPGVQNIATPQQAADASSQQQREQQQTPLETAPQISIRPQAASADSKLRAQPARAGDAAAQPAIPSPADRATTFAAPAPAAADPPHPDAPAAPARAVVSDALRNAEAVPPTAPTTRTGTAQEISIRIAQPDASPVDLRVTERSGQVRVDVRTNDTAMQTTLRQDLGALANSLQRAGYHAEIITPASPAGRAASNFSAGNRETHQDSSRNGGGSPDFTGGRRQQQHQKRTGNWLEEQEDQP